jgi:CheY-like chemotaxis protein
MGLFQKFKEGLQKTHVKLAHEIKRIVTRAPRMGPDALDELEALLISADLGVETATIDVDSQGRLWLASDGTTTVAVRYSDPPYSSWSGPITLATGISTDDISVVTALPNGTVGVLWSNQSTQRFGFRAHVDEIRAVLLDMTMPHVNGQEVFKRMRRIRKDVPIILSSGYNEQDAIARFSGRGLAGFIQKPYQIHVLTKKLSQILK